jgi:hypothetical protein
MFPFEFRPLEIENKSDMKTGYLQVIQHLAKFMVYDLIDHLGIHYNFSRHYQVRNVIAYRDSFIDHIETRLLLAGNIAMLQLNHERILVWLLQQPVSQCIQDFHRRANHSLGNAPTRQSVFIGVYQWFHCLYCQNHG